MTAGAVTILVLSIYIYGAYGSYAVLGLAFASGYLPFALASPFAGALTDRWGQRRALLISNAGSLACAMATALLVVTGTIALSNAVPLLVIVIVFKALQMTSVESSVPLLVPKRLYGRVNGSRMLLSSTSAIMGPVVTGLLLQVLDVGGVSLVACAFMVPAIVATMVLRIPPAPPAPSAPPASETTPSRSLRAEIMEAARQIRLARGLVALLAFLGAISVAIGFVELAVQEMAYGFAGELSIALIFTVGWTGILTTSIAMTISDRPRHLVRGMLAAGLVFAVGLGLAGLRPNVVLVALASFVGLGSTPVVMGVIQTAIHLKVRPGLMGRAIGLKNAVVGSAHMVGNTSAGVLGAVFVPLIGRAEVRSPAVAAVVGEGGGRGFAVLMIAMGTAVAVTTFLASRHGRLARWQELPDVTPDDRAAVPAPVPSVPAHASR
jgi:MFS family permease